MANGHAFTTSPADTAPRPLPQQLGVYFEPLRQTMVEGLYPAILADEPISGWGCEACGHRVDCDPPLVFAEIVETETAAKALQGMGCHYGQGYYFSEPIEADLALQWLRTQEPFQPPPTTSGARKGCPPIPARSATSETMRVRTLDEDASPTIVVQTSTIDFSSDEEPE